MTASNQEPGEIDIPGIKRKHSRHVVKHILNNKNLLQNIKIKKILGLALNFENSNEKR